MSDTDSVFDDGSGDDSNGSKLNLSKLISALIAPSPGAAQMGGPQPPQAPGGNTMTAGGAGDQSTAAPPVQNMLQSALAPSSAAAVPPDPDSVTVPDYGTYPQNPYYQSRFPKQPPTATAPTVTPVPGSAPTGGDSPPAAPLDDAGPPKAAPEVSGADPSMGLGGAPQPTPPMVPMPRPAPGMPQAAAAPPPVPPPGVAPPPPQASRAATAGVGPAGAVSRYPQQTIAPQPAGAQGPWMSGVFGKDPRLAAQIAGSLGAGLKSVGTNWNKPGLAAFAGSAGSALEGGQKGDDDFFRKTKEAKTEALAYAAAGDKSKLNDALVKLREAQAVGIRDHGTMTSRASDWRNSDTGKLQMADAAAEKEIESFRKGNETRQKNPDPVEQKKWQDDFAAKSKEIRENAYKRYGFTPESAEKTKKLGTPALNDKGVIDIKATQDQAFKPGSLHEFNAIVPVGGYFINPKDGQLRRRTSEQPPPADAPGGILSVTGPKVPSVDDLTPDSEAA